MGLFSLIASLPQLVLFETPPVSSEKFLSFCSSCLGAKEYELAARWSLVPSDALAALVSAFPVHSLPRAYYSWELALRNSIAKIRAARLPGHGPAERPEAGYEADADSVVRAAFSVRDPLEREKILDRARWNKIGELQHKYSRHGFTLDAVYAYRIRLLIAEKWAARKGAEAPDNLERTASAVRTGTAFTEKETEE